MMEELIVEWTLVRNKHVVLESFKKSNFGFRIRNIDLIAEQKSDPDIGRVDLIYETDSGNILIVELETGIKDRSKYNFCISQTMRYTDFKEKYFDGRDCTMVILFDDDGTPRDFKDELGEFADRNNIILSKYSMKAVERMYEEEIDRLSKIIGIKMRPPTSDMPYTMSAINRFLMAFKITGRDSLTPTELAKTLPTTKGKNKGRPWSRTSVLAHEYLCNGIGSIEVFRHARNKEYKLTPVGKELIDGMNLLGEDPKEIIKRVEKIPLSISQRRIIISQFLQDPKPSKVRSLIFSFLRYIDVTRGERIPK